MQKNTYTYGYMLQTWSAHSQNRPFLTPKPLACLYHALTLYPADHVVRIPRRHLLVGYLLALHGRSTVALK